MNRNKGFHIIVCFTVMLALASLACGMGDIPNLFATETPTPTATFTPSPTVTPSPTFTPTATPTPTNTPLPTGAESQEQPDGSTLFIDYDNLYRLTIPADWFVLPLSSKDIGEILQKIAAEKPEFEDTAQNFLKLDPDVIRVVAINKNTKYVFSGFSTNLTITAIEDKIMSAMPLDFVTGALEEALKQQGATLISEHSLAFTNAHGVEIAPFEFEQMAPTARGTKVKVYSKTFIFQTGKKVIMVQLATPQQFTEELTPVLDEIADSIELIKP